MALAEVADRSEVRRIKRDNHHEIVPLAAGSRNAPRRIQPACIAMQQKRNHHARIERRLAEPTLIYLLAIVGDGLGLGRLLGLACLIVFFSSASVWPCFFRSALGPTSAR